MATARELYMDRISELRSNKDIGEQAITGMNTVLDALDLSNFIRTRPEALLLNSGNSSLVLERDIAVDGIMSIDVDNTGRVLVTGFTDSDFDVSDIFSGSPQGFGSWFLFTQWPRVLNGEFM